jgi:hypothetical protein
VPKLISSGSEAAGLSCPAPGARPRSGISLIIKANKKMMTAAGMPNTKTLCTPCVIAWKMTSRCPAGSEVTCAGSKLPPCAWNPLAPDELM